MRWAAAARVRCAPTTSARRWAARWCASRSTSPTNSRTVAVNAPTCRGPTGYCATPVSAADGEEAGQVLLVAAHFLDQRLLGGSRDVERNECFADRDVRLGAGSVDRDRDRVGGDEQAAE